MNNSIERCIATYFVQRDIPEDISPLHCQKKI